MTKEKLSCISSFYLLEIKVAKKYQKLHISFYKYVLSIINIVIKTFYAH